MVPLALVVNLATRWHHLHELKYWPPDGATCISYMNWQIGHQMAPLALVSNLATRWHHLHLLQIRPPDGATYFSCKFSHQMAPLALVANLVTRWHHLHWFQSWPPGNVTCTLPHCLGLPYWHYQLVLSLYLHQLESHQLILHKWLSLSVRDNRIHRSDQGHLGPIKIQEKFWKNSNKTNSGKSVLTLR